MKWINEIEPKRLIKLLLLLFSLLFMPYIVLCFYAHPIADDYTYNNINNFWLGQKLLYLHWNGRYSANFLIMANPILFNSFTGYRLAALALLLLMPVSIYFILLSVTGKAFSLLERSLISIMGSLLILSLLPSLPEGIYWFPGSMTYILGCCVAMFYIGCMILFLQKRYLINRFIHIFLSTVLLFIAVGFNEVQMLLLVCAHLIIWIVIKKGKRYKSIGLIMLLLCAIFSSFVFFSPGNYSREAYFPGKHNLLHSILMTLLQIPRFFFSWVSYTPLLISSILFAPISVKLNNHSGLFRKLASYKPLALFAVLWGILLLCIFPPYWSTAILGQHRTLNTACFFFIPAWFVFLHTIYSKNSLAERISLVLNRYVKAMLTILLFTTLLFSGNGGNVLMDFASGKIAGFNREMNKRYEIIAQAKKTGQAEVTMLPLQNKPVSLFVLDIQPGCNHWINQQFAQFYGLKKICCDTMVNQNSGN